MEILFLGEGVSLKIEAKEGMLMSELPGNIHEKIGDLRVEKGLTKKQVSENLGISASQLTRIENQDIKSIGHELLIKFADYYNVSTDYLLGRSKIRARKNVDLDELGLSNKALVLLLSGKINMQLLSRIIEHKYFLPLMDYAEAYFESVHDEGFSNRNAVIDMAVTDISEYVKTNTSLRNEGRKDMRHLKAQKITGSEADLQKLNSMFMQIMRDVKKQYGETPSDISRQEMQKQIQAVHDEALHAYEQGNMNVRTMADITAKMIEPLGLEEEQMQAFKDLMVDILLEEAE